MLNNNAKAVYAAYAKDETIRTNSSSGGIFSLLAEEILYKDGIVYGVALSHDCKSAEFIRVDDMSDLFKLRGSKYLQARVGSTYEQVKEDLESGLNVLFSGVGCQINGLRVFLNKSYENLFCVDVICHGVPSPALWRKYVEYMEKQNKAELVSVNFRCKDDSWQDFGMKELDKNQKQVYISKDKDPFMQMFLRNYCLRPSCYECVAKDLKLSDITIADFWGIEKVAPDMGDGKGTSLVIIRNEIGTKIFDGISKKLVYREVTYEDAVSGNPSEYKSVIRPKERDVFFRNMNTLEFSVLQKKYVTSISDSFAKRIKKKIKRICHRCLNGMLKKVFDRTNFRGGGGVKTM